MKVYNFAFVTSCDNESSYCFDRIPLCVQCKENEKKIIFNYLRKTFLETYNKTLKMNLKSYKNYKIGLTITTIDIKKDTSKNRNVYINPLNLKNK